MKKEIIDLEEAVRIAQLTQDTDFLEKLLADDFQFITSQGKLVTKREDIDQYKSGYLKITNVDIWDRTINMYGTTAITRFRVKFAGQAGEYSFSSNFLFTRVYSKHEDRWKMVAGHSSDIQ